MGYQRNTKTCLKCGKEISLSNYGKHFEACDNKKNKNKVLNENWKIGENQYQCPECSKIFSKSGIVLHYRFTHLGEKNPMFGKKGKNSWIIAKEKGIPHQLSKKQKEYFESEKCYKHLRNVGNNWWKNPESLKKFKKSIRLAIEKNPEAYSTNNVCGRTKIVEYNGFKLNGGWELSVAKWLDENNIEWTNKIEKGFEYLWEGDIHLYFPDFYLPKHDTYIEVKGYERERDKCKWKSLNNLIVLKKNEIKKIRNETYIAQW